MAANDNRHTQSNSGRLHPAGCLAGVSNSEAWLTRSCFAHLSYQIYLCLGLWRHQRRLQISGHSLLSTSRDLAHCAHEPLIAAAFVFMNPRIAGYFASTGITAAAPVGSDSNNG